MNKNLRKFSVLILSGLLLACGSDDDATEPTKPIEPEFPTEYSEKSVEENKGQLEDNGIALVNKVTTLKSSSGIQTSIAFSNHLDGSTLPDNLSDGRASSSKTLGFMQLLASFGRGNSSFGKLASGARTTAVEFESFQQYYNDLIGVYVYNKANNSWSYTKTGTKIVFQFPSTENGTSNNAEYVIYDYKGTTISGGGGIGDDDYTGDYPTALKIDLTIDGNKKVEYSLATSYDSKGTPTSLTISIVIDSYQFLYELVNTKTEAKLDYTLRESGNVLFAFGARGKGSFEVDNVEGSEEVDDVITDGSAYFQIMNIKFSGEIDTKSLYTELDNADTKEEEAAIWNKYYKLIVFYDDTKKKIADSEFYVVTGEETYCEWVPEDLDGNGQIEWWEETCEEHSRETKELDVRIVFADGSKSDLATYTDVGFSDLEDELNEFIDSFE
jgi:hypothetical protein